MDKEKLLEYTAMIVKGSLQGQKDNPSHGLNKPENIAELIKTVYATLKELD